MHAEYCVISTTANNLHVQLDVSVPSATTLAHGAGKSCRVQQDTVAKNALCFVTHDLRGAHTIRVSHTLLKSVLLHDRKCALATFQARSSHQRLRAVAAALTRMGLDDKAEEILAWVEQLPTVVQQEYEQAIHSSPESRRAGSPDWRQAMAVGPVGQSAIPDEVAPPAADPQSDHVQVSATAFRDLTMRLAAVEAWAHAFDSQLVRDESEENRAVLRASELLAAVAKQAVRDAQSAASDDCLNRVVSLEARLPYGQSHQADLDYLCQRQTKLERDLEACQTSVAATAERIEPELGSMSTNSPYVTEEKFLRLVRAVAGNTQKLVRNEKVLSTLHARLGSDLPGQPSVPHQQMVDQPTDGTTHQHIMKLLDMHTRAISQTWHWVSANVRVTQQHAAWLSKVSSSQIRPDPVPSGVSTSTANTSDQTTSAGVGLQDPPAANSGQQQVVHAASPLPTDEVTDGTHDGVHNTDSAAAPQSVQSENAETRLTAQQLEAVTSLPEESRDGVVTLSSDSEAE
eukprot:6443764-Amphidinium_carterae.4